MPVRYCRTIWCPGTDFHPETCTPCSSDSSWHTTRWRVPCWPWRCKSVHRDREWAVSRNTSACRCRRFSNKCNPFLRHSAYSTLATSCKKSHIKRLYYYTYYYTYVITFYIISIYLNFKVYTNSFGLMYGSPINIIGGI